MRRSDAGSARRYAHALLDVAFAQADPAQLREDLRRGAALLRAERELEAALTHPGVPPERRRAVAKAIFAGRSSPLMARLVDLLAERGRVALLPQIEQAYAEAWNAHRGVVAAEATSAVPLDGAQAQALGGALRAVSGREVELRQRVDPAVLGGVVVRMGERTYDGTVRAQLAGLRRRLLAGA
jgi:F-type H+-transporting ATPase subunit delta